MAENIPTKEHASEVYHALMVVWGKGEMTEAEFISAVAVNLGKIIGWMKYNPVDFLPMVMAADAACERIGDLLAEIERGGGRDVAAEVRRKESTQDRIRDYRKRITAAEAERNRLAARVGELEGALKKAATLDVGRPIPGDGREHGFTDGIRSGQDEARQFVKEIARQALASDGSAVADVIAAGKEMRDFKVAGKTHRTDTSVDFGLWNKFCGVLTRLDGREADDAE